MPTDSHKTRVIIYTRPGCHLCDEAKQIMKSADCENEYTLSEVNIETDPDLLQRYRFEIPVITVDGIEAFRHRLTVDAFRAKLAACPKT